MNLLPACLYGPQLEGEINQARAILNSHFREGVYTAPRFLIACLAGKPIVSKNLADPFKAGTHYIDLLDRNAVDKAEIYDNFSHLATNKLFFLHFFMQH